MVGGMESMRDFFGTNPVVVALAGVVLLWGLWHLVKHLLVVAFVFAGAAALLWGYVTWRDQRVPDVGALLQRLWKGGEEHARDYVEGAVEVRLRRALGPAEGSAEGLSRALDGYHAEGRAPLPPPPPP